MKIVIAGGNGFLATSLVDFLKNKASEIILIARNPVEAKENIRYMHWDGLTLGTWVRSLEDADVVINLAGKNVDCRYTEKNKKAIYDSRLKSTSALGEAIKRCAKPPKLWINASSATIYKASFEKLMTENTGDIGDDFSMDVCKQWEAVFNSYNTLPIRQVIMRISIVLGWKGAALPALKNLARVGFGGSQGNGEQYCSWIHVLDFCRAVEWFMENDSASGAFNVTAPLPLRNREFMKTLRNVMGIRVGMNIPEPLLKLGAFFLRTEPELVLKSRKVYPKRLLDEGFVFEFPEFKTAALNLWLHRKMKD